MNRRDLLGLAGAMGATAALPSAARAQRGLETGSARPTSSYRRITTEEAFAMQPQLKGFRAIGKRAGGDRGTPPVCGVGPMQGRANRGHAWIRARPLCVIRLRSPFDKFRANGVSLW